MRSTKELIYCNHK